jgi:MaoC like domain
MTTFTVGDPLPPFTRDSGFAYWNRYAAVNDEFIPIHMEDDAGQAAGYPTAFGMGNLTWAYLHVALHQWFGEEARVAAVGAQFRSAVTRGKRVVVTGVVTAVHPAAGDDDLDEVELTLRAQDQDGTLLAPGTATVVVRR